VSGPAAILDRTRAGDRLFEPSVSTLHISAPELEHVVGMCACVNQAIAHRAGDVEQVAQSAFIDTALDRAVSGKSSPDRFGLAERNLSHPRALRPLETTATDLPTTLNHEILAKYSAPHEIGFERFVAD
jgi:hypothetical protein